VALSGNTVFEVRTDGADTNGGGFVTGAAGTDYSQQASPQKSGTDLAIHASDATKVQPVAAGVAAADVGNLVQITAGTGFTAGWYEITAQDGTYWTLDRAAGTTSSTGGTYAMGGALASPGQLGKALINHGVSGMVAYLQSGTHDVSVNADNVAGGKLSLAAYDKHLWIEGYGSVRGDLSYANMPVVRDTVDIGNDSLFHLDGLHYTNFIYCVNVKFDGNNLANYGPYADTYGVFVLCECVNHDSFGFYGGVLIGCRSLNNGSWNFYNSNQCFFCLSDGGSSSVGFRNPNQALSNCVALGESGDGFQVGSNALEIDNCSAINCGGDGFQQDGGSYDCRFMNCHAQGNGAYGFDVGSAALLLNCSGYNNTSGHYNGAPHVLNFQTITDGDPLTNAAGDDLSPNATANRGALMRAAALDFLGLSHTHNLDIGAVQHADPAGGGGGGRRPRGLYLGV